MAGSLRRVPLFVALVGVASCGSGFMSVVLDLPPQAPRAETVSAAASGQVGLAYYMPVDTVRPRIESTVDPDSTRALLPRDNAGNIDWMEALRRGIIKPRSATPGDSVVGPPSTFNFGFDFFFPGPNPMFDAYFPHSSHTEWVSCEHCHTRIFKYRDTEIQMADVLQGRFCGECHGRVAFPVETGCERCHINFPQPADRAQPEFIGDIVMSRVQRAPAQVAAEIAAKIAADSVPKEPTETAAAEDSPAPVGDLFYPPATFPHWVHRIRYQCKACHIERFEPAAGANAITMSDIDGGNACGTCHDGATAFDAGFGQCHRCHVTPAETVREPGAEAAAGDGSAEAVVGDTSGTPRAPIGSVRATGPLEP